MAPTWWLHGVWRTCVPRTLLFLLIICLLAPVASARASRQSPRCHGLGQVMVGDEYITQLTSYASLREQEVVVSDVVSRSMGEYGVGIEILPRAHIVSLVPTDFVLLRLFTCEYTYGRQCHRSEQVLTHPLSEPIKRFHVNKPHEHVDLLQHVRRPLRDLHESPRMREARARKQQPQQLVDELGVRALWERGYRGQGVKVGVFDTGLSNTHFHNVKQRINWTNERKTDDLVGHGTFVSSIIGGADANCPGLAPDAELFVFRTFTTDQLSFTSWFLDAFNYALFLRLNVLNLSTGGPDFQDLPFVEKIQELTANGVIVVSAVGNNGPKYGTLTNPADQMEVIGVGALGRNGDVAPFSSRGMTTWELPFGTGRVKPDLIALAEEIPGAEVSRGCKLLSGTSVAAPIVSGAIAVLASIIPDEHARWTLLNPASIKQILVESADRVAARELKQEWTVQNHIFEQGSGALNVTKASTLVHKMWTTYQAQQQLEPNRPQVAFNHTVTSFPSSIDATDCPYMWPLCSQPIFHTSLPLVVNLTLINPTSVSGTLEGTPRWIPADPSGEHLSVSIASPTMLWPYYGSVGVFFEVKESGATFNGTAHGSLQFLIRTHASVVQELLVPVHLPIIATPPRATRILWDQFHNLAYPSGFVPRDALENHEDLLDSAGDHPHSNFHQVWNFLSSHGYFVEILPFEYSCIDLMRYGVVLIVDPEEEYFKDEIVALQAAVKYSNTSLLVFADWYDDALLDSMELFDTSTLSQWHPITGGANLPALNSLLRAFNIEFAYDVRSNASVSLLSHGSGSLLPAVSFPYWSGSYLTKFPVGGYLGYIEAEDQSVSILNRSTLSAPISRVPVLGLYEVPSRNGGRIAVFGDSSCLDAGVHPSSGPFRHCFEMLLQLIRFTNDAIRPLSAQLELLHTEYGDPEKMFSATRLVDAEEVPGTVSKELRTVDEGGPFMTTSQRRTALMQKHSKVLRALEQKPTRQSFCHFYRREQCHEELSTKVTVQVVE